MTVLINVSPLPVEGKTTNTIDSTSTNTIDSFVAEQLKQGKKSNSLISEKSPYLLQHAFNPVDWYPWGKEAIERAKTENKPIFLSIGYSTCHWCHVMERESFENPEIAAIMNKYFICIKVDREERPDLDQVYMAVTQALTGSGGWPMSVFLTPDLEPFFAGTYFPPETRYGRPGFPDLLQSIHNAWVKDSKKVIESAQSIVQRLIEINEIHSGKGSVSSGAVHEAVTSFMEHFDDTYGGFGNSPKFPRPAALEFLFRYGVRAGDKKSVSMVMETLEIILRLSGILRLKSLRARRQREIMMAPI